jgi:hypothetical protein
MARGLVEQNPVIGTLVAPEQPRKRVLSLAELNHVSCHKAGVAGIYNRATYEKEKHAALVMWAEHVLATVGGRPAAVVARSPLEGQPDGDAAGAKRSDALRTPSLQARSCGDRSMARVLAGELRRRCSDLCWRT